MKKTLVALAALAATGAFAQVTLSGSAAFGYVQTTTAGADAGGFGFDDSTVNFDAKEDLGGGMTASVRLAAIGFDRSGASATAPYATGANGPVTGQNANITLATPSYVLTLASNKLGDYLHQGVAAAGSNATTYYYHGDGALWGRARRDIVQLAIPMGALTVGLAHMEGGNNLGLGGGAAGTTGSQRLNAVVVSYAAGALAADAHYLVFDNRVDNSATSLKDIVRLSGNYNLGVAKLGAGLENLSYTAGNTRNRLLLGVNVPMGAVSVGAQWAQEKTDGGGAAFDGTRSGYTLGMKYDLSKRTSAFVNYGRFDNALGTGLTNSKTAVLLAHSF